MQVVIGTDGSLRCIYNEALLGLTELGGCETRRASRVEPIGEQWTADLSPVGGPVLGPFRLRSEALAAEVKWLEEHDSPAPEA